MTDYSHGRESRRATMYFGRKINQPVKNNSLNNSNSRRLENLPIDSKPIELSNIVFPTFGVIWGYSIHLREVA